MPATSCSRAGSGGPVTRGWRCENTHPPATAASHFGFRRPRGARFPRARRTPARRGRPLCSPAAQTSPDGTAGQRGAGGNAGSVPPPSEAALGGGSRHGDEVALGRPAPLTGGCAFALPGTRAGWGQDAAQPTLRANGQGLKGRHIAQVAADGAGDLTPSWCLLPGSAPLPHSQETALLVAHTPTPPLRSPIFPWPVHVGDHTSNRLAAGMDCPAPSRDWTSTRRQAVTTARKCPYVFYSHKVSSPLESVRQS